MITTLTKLAINIAKTRMIVRKNQIGAIRVLQVLITQRR